MRWPWKRKPAPYRYVRPEIDTRTDEQKLIAWLEQLPAGEARQIRVDAGWSQRQMAEKCGLSQPTQVGRWERNGRGWTRHSGLRYARLLRELEGTSEF